jgi:hypothetical protein
MGFITREGLAGETGAARDTANARGYEAGPQPGAPPEPPRPVNVGPWDWARNWENYSKNIDVWKAQAHAMRHAYRSQRHAAHHAAKDAAHAGVAEMMDESRPFGYPEYRERVIEHAHKARAGFIAHLFPFLAVNGFLFFIWASTGAGFPWYLFPLGGWAVGLVSHLAAARTRQRERAEVEALPQNLGVEDYKLLRKFHKARSGARSAATALLAVSGLLVMINVITSAGYPWCLFPIGGMMIGLVSAVSSYLVRRGGFLKRIRHLIKNKSSLEAERVASGEREEDSPLVKQAVSLASSILAQAKDLGKDKAFGGEDLKPLLDNYITQLRTLTKKSGEVQGIIAAIPHMELDRDLVELHRRYQAVTSESLKREYQKSIEQIEHHNKSYEELKNQKELMDLKINNSFNSLTQMQLDLARMAGLTTAMAPSSIDTFKQKTQELSNYLDDVASSYQELEGTPRLGEKERAEADKLLAEFKKKTLESDEATN